MANLINKVEVVGCVPDIDVPIENEEDEYGICLTHAGKKHLPSVDDVPLTPLSGHNPSPGILPLAPTKQPREDTRSRLPTFTRDDFLEADLSDSPSIPCGQLERVRDTNLHWTEQDQERSELECSLLYCSDCCQDACLTATEADLHLIEMNTALENISSGEPICMGTCHFKIMSAVPSQELWPDVSILKQFISSQEAPLKIEYRCPTCRNCSPCRNAVDTEKVSLREEAEDMEITASVKLDFPNKRFICNLPLRGKEEEFLASNRSSAEKVLERQCKTYAKDEETRELIVRAMSKLFDNGHVELLENLTREQQQMILAKKVNYFIPWRVVFKKSLSTPARPVFDCSSRTPTRPDGSGGRCLNDLMCKGKTMSLNLIKMLLKFLIGRFALSCDLKQFYNCFKLIEDQWHLQLFLWKKNMNPDEETKTAVIKTLIYGNKAAAPQSEEGIKQFADFLKPANPRLAEFLLHERFVDDLNGSEASKAAIDKLQADCEAAFATLGVEAKGWAKSGEAPPLDISDDGSLGVGGMGWTPELDCIEVKFSPLHFGRVSRGRLVAGTQIFDGKFGTWQEMEILY